MRVPATDVKGLGPDAIAGVVCGYLILTLETCGQVGEVAGLSI
jgi:hypothetical protein